MQAIKNLSSVEGGPNVLPVKPDPLNVIGTVDPCE